MKGLVNMEYAKLGNTDIEVSKLCVGCMSFGKPGTLHDWTLDESGTEEIVKHALDLGINFFDTANQILSAAKQTGQLWENMTGLRNRIWKSSAGFIVWQKNMA